MLVGVRLDFLWLLFLAFINRVAAGHSKLRKVALCLHRALMDRTVLQAQPKHGRIDALFTVEDAFDLSI